MSHGIDVASVTHRRLVAAFAEGVIARSPTHAAFLRGSLDAMGEATFRDLAGYLAFCEERGIARDYLVECYNTIVVDTLREQVHFRKTGRYRHATFAAVAQRVYFDDAYMKKYMYGLALTSFLWPNHTAMHDFFVATFPRGTRGGYLEVGPGHGYYFMKAAGLGAFERMTGIDISATSVAMTRDILEHAGVGRSGVAVDVIEATSCPSSQRSAGYSCIVMGEVLEHVEDLGAFLRRIAALSGCPATHVYLTTCVNAPAVDPHLSVPRSGRDRHAGVGQRPSGRRSPSTSRTSGRPSRSRWRRRWR